MDDHPLLDAAAAISDRRAATTTSASEGIRLLDRIARSFGASPRDRSEPRAASLFLWGPLEVRRVLGAGSFGEVFAAWDPTLQREVALKLRTPETGALRWLDEARHLARVRHPNVLTVHGADVLDGRAGIWTELVAGQTLEAMLSSSGPFSEAEVLRIGRDVASALAAVHAAGLVHGDVKTANIMLEDVESPRRAVLVDFGSADRQSTGDDLPAYLVGTPLTMAPEVLDGRAATGAADVYGLGATLFRLLTGRYPIDVDSIEKLRDAHRSGARASLRSLAPEVSPRLARAIDRALEPDPAARWQNAATFRRALEDAADPTRRIRARAAAIGAGVAALAAVIVVGILIMRPGPGPISRAALASPRSPGILHETWRQVGTRFQSNWGQDAAVVDIDGDGFGDMVVGESMWIGADSIARGRVLVFRGSAAGPSGTGETVLTGNVPGFAYGFYAADAGDVDGDGYHDLLITEVPYKMEEGPGRVFLFRGGPGWRAFTPVWSRRGQTRDSGFGLSMMAGDVDGDGYSDVVIGEPVGSDKLDREGIVRVFMGSPAGLAQEPAWTVRGEQAVAQLGAWMHATGDVNGDGFDDVLVSAAVWDGATTDCGQARLYLGGKDGVAAKPAWTVEGAGTNSHLGTMVSGAGDVNGDGFGDVVVGEPQYSDESRPERGRVLLFLGGRDGLSKTPAWHALGPIAYTHLGYSVLGLGDIDGDGFADIAVGSPQYSEGKRTHMGMVEVYRGTRDGCEATAAWRAVGGAEDEHLGFTMARGDMNGDGLPDLIVAAPLYSDAIRERGLLVSYLGQRLPK